MDVGKETRPEPLTEHTNRVKFAGSLDLECSRHGATRVRFGGETGRCCIRLMEPTSPTALLRNWEKESLERLSELGLGQRIDAYRSALKQLKLPRSGQGRDQDTLDVARLCEADWILTAYETLTDHERSFARIAYPSFRFDR